ncbi:MAG: lysophospholipid acyltransferase family protein [Limisphaerales bacterium]
MRSPVKPPTSGPIIPHKAKWHGLLAARLIWLLSSSVAATLRWRWHDQTNLFENGGKEPVIFCLWHNRLALSLILFRRYVQARQPQRTLAALVSASRDGGMLARVLELFAVVPVRGSSSRRGPQALRELVSAAEQGCDLAITPDGPRGPCYVVQEGIISLAALTGMTIVPASFHLSCKWRLKTWDRFQVPPPFARCEVQLGQPLRIPRDATDAEREQLRLELETRMKAITID